MKLVSAAFSREGVIRSSLRSLERQIRKLRKRFKRVESEARVTYDVSQLTPRAQQIHAELLTAIEMKRRRAA